MKKGYILTWHYLDNYGSVLQAYALQEIFRNNGIDMRILNYRENAKIGILADFLRVMKYNFPTNSSLTKRKQKFYKFRKKYLLETKMFNSIEALQDFKYNIDFIVCGSDQIWSSKRFDPVYFLDFIPDKNVKKYAYAPSTIEEYKENQKKIIGSSLELFQKISVREALGVKILKKITKKEVIEVLDPTLVLSIEKWEEILKSEEKINIPSEDYLICYFIGENDKYKKVTNDIKEKYNCSLIININIKNIHNFGDKILREASPLQFLKLIKNAKVVVSDSYHAILFSIIFNKEFYAIKRFENNENDNQNERINNILNKINCKNRYINANENKLDNNELLYEDINNQLKKYIQRSEDYINNIIEEVENDSDK